jgi:DNA-binding response OmpR family regulator
MAVVLIATDDAKLYGILAAELGGDAHDVLWAADGREALEMVRQESPGLVLLDVHLPLFDGFETCEMLRADPDIPSALPVVLLSDERENPYRVDKVCATEVFPKTHSYQELREHVAEWAGARL